MPYHIEYAIAWLHFLNILSEHCGRASHKGTIDKALNFTLGDVALYLAPTVHSIMLAYISRYRRPTNCYSIGDKYFCIHCQLS